MMSEIVQSPPTTEIKEKTNEEKTTEIKKNPKRVSAGKKGAEAKKMRAELKRKEVEAMKKENMKLKSITKDDDKVTHALDYDKSHMKLKKFNNNGHILYTKIISPYV